MSGDFLHAFFISFQKKLKPFLRYLLYIIQHPLGYISHSLDYHGFQHYDHYPVSVPSARLPQVRL